MSIISENQFQAQLNLAHCRGCGGNSPYISKITHRLDDKIRRVEITFRGPVIEHRIVVPARAKVWSLVTALRHTAGLARSHLDVDGQAAADRIAPVQGPVCQQVTERAARLFPPMTAGPVRKLVGVSKNEVVLNMQRGEAPIGRKILPVVVCEASGSRNLFRPLDSSASSIIDVARPGVGGIECQTGAQTLLHNQLESVVNLIA